MPSRTTDAHPRPDLGDVGARRPRLGPEAPEPVRDRAVLGERGRPTWGAHAVRRASNGRIEPEAGQPGEE